jgi:hypothetical protein
MITNQEDMDISNSKTKNQLINVLMKLTLYNNQERKSPSLTKKSKSVNSRKKEKDPIIKITFILKIFPKFPKKKLRKN